MNRRFFSQLLALGAGSLGLWQGRARGDDELAQGPADAQPGTVGDPKRAGRKTEPVNVADFQELAKAALPPATYDYITTGTTDEVTLRDNVAAFQRLRLLPPLLTGVAEVDTSTTVLK